MNCDTVDERIGKLLDEIGVDGLVAAIEPLSGGVSSDVFRVDFDGRRSICVKFALERLRVTREWHAPVCRSAAEYRWLATVGEWLPTAVPGVIGYDEAQHGLAMAYLSPEIYPNWKAELLRGTVDPTIAPKLGERLASIHSRSATEPDLAESFANEADFEALRIEPYLRFTAKRHPDLASRLDELAEALAKARIALVHGDVSPKNILSGPDGPVFIDAECATYGDPAFDVAFVLNHLAIKSLVLAHGGSVLGQAHALWNAYRRGIDWEPVAVTEMRVAALLPALMLARADGKSPLEYLTDETTSLVRGMARALLKRRPDTVAAFLASIEEGT